MIILYTLIQIIIESFPVSSSGHALLLCGPAAASGDYDYFLHGFSVLVILVYFFRDYFFLLRHAYIARACIARLCATVIIADCVTACFYVLLPYTILLQLPLWAGFVITGCALFSTTLLRRPWPAVALAKAGWPTRALIIGLAQGIALVPGISRMGITYAVARWLGLRPYRAMALSLAIQMPLIGAGFLKGVYGLYHAGELTQYFSVYWLCVYASATVLAYLGLCFTMFIARRGKIWLFGVYVLLLACLL